MIIGEKVILRPLRFSDWEKTLLWRNNLEIKSSAMIHSFPITEEQEKTWYQKALADLTDKSVYLAIDTFQDKHFIGYIFLKNINYINRNCTLGIILGNKTEQGKGYGTEAMQLIGKYAFETLNLNKITLEVVAFNKPAITLYKKVGYIIEGTLQKQYYFDNNYHDIIIMSRFNENK